MAKTALKHFVSRRLLRDALDGVPHEKFIRIIGLFNAVVPPEVKAKKDGTYQNPLAREFEQLREMIESKLAENNLIFQRDEMGDHVHNLNLLLGELVPAATLESALPALRDEYRARVGMEVYGVYLGSRGYKALEGCDRTNSSEDRLRLLRADYLQLTNEIRKMTLLDYHIEETRSFLIRKLRRTLCKLLVAPLAIVLIFLLCQIAIIDVQRSRESVPATFTAGQVDDAEPPLKLYLSPDAAVKSAKPPAVPGPAASVSRFVARYLMGSGENTWTTLYKALVMVTLLCLAGMAGAIGSFISALLRIEAVPETTEIARNVVSLRYSESIRLAPVTGFIFAILLSFVFGGKLLNGNLFPDTNSPNWVFLLFIPAELAKWLVWSFLVGFCERLMPDMIDRLVAKADKSVQTSAPPSVNGSKGPSGRNGSGGHDQDRDTFSPLRRRSPGKRSKRPAPQHAS